jgi:hypothetical protein
MLIKNFFKLKVTGNISILIKAKYTERKLFGGSQLAHRQQTDAN